MNSYSELLEACKGYDRIIVTGPQRSGTTFTARALAKSLGVQMVDEHQHPSRLEADKYVWQYACHNHKIHKNKNVDLVIWMNRDREDVMKSEKRISWKSFERHKREYVSVFGVEAKAFDNNYDMKHHFWNTVQKDKISARVVEFDYNNLKDAPGYLPKEERKDFTCKQTC